MKRIHVVAAVIRGDHAGRDNQILLSKRPDHLHQGGKWEFPGGKVEQGEAPEVALVRELEEELGIIATKYQPLIQIHHDYSDKAVFLDVWEVSAFEGVPLGMEGQLVEWVESRLLADYEFPAANVPIVAAAVLSPRYWITPELDDSPGAFVSLVEAKLAAGVKQMQLRLKACDSTLLPQIVDEIVALCDRFNSRLFINGDTWELLDEAQAVKIGDAISGVHLTAKQLHNSTKGYDGVAIAASCHTYDDIKKAEQIGCQFVTLSPIKTTASHPELEPLDLEESKTWVKGAKLPVYALGGMSDGDIQDMRREGFQGVAGIREVGA